MFSQFECYSFTSETTVEVVLDKTCRAHEDARGPDEWVRPPQLPPAPRDGKQCPSSQLPGGLPPCVSQRRVPSHFTGPAAPWMCNPYPPQSITGAPGLRLQEGERKHIFITVIEPDTFSVWRPRSGTFPPSSLFPSRCVFWMAYPGVCCVNVHENVVCLLHPWGSGGATNSLPQRVPPWHIQSLSTGLRAGLDHSLRQPYWALATRERTIEILAPAGHSPQTLSLVLYLLAQNETEGNRRLKTETTG